MKLLDFINEKTNNAYKEFKLVSVIFDEETKECLFKFLYKDIINDGDKDRLITLIKEYFKEDVPIVVKCKKAYIDIDLIKDIVHNYIINNYNSVGIDFDKDRIIVNISDSINVKVNCTEFQYKYLNNNAIIKDIIDYSQGFFFENFDLELLLDGNSANQTIEEIVIDNTLFDVSEDNANNIKYHKVSNINNYIGEVVGTPIHISCIKSARDDIEIAGKIRFLTQKSFESKRKDKEGNSIIKEYYSFTLTDKTGRINCVYFPVKADVAKSVNITDDQNVILHGSVEEYNGRINFKVKALGYCEIIEEVEAEEVEVPVISEPFDKYYYVNPEPYVEMFQDNLFLIRDEIGEYLMNNDVVVFDIETTGLEATRCEIIEIGAVKLHNGRISETFETLIKPKGEIPEEIINLTGITPDMVVNAPSIKQVMPDFYKFCFGTTIMAYNIDFDYKFISVHGKKLGYVFDNKQIDVLFLARAYVPGLKNFKLSTVCKKLGVSLENAHRAVHDAMATAEVVIKLSPNITEN